MSDLTNRNFQVIEQAINKLNVAQGDLRAAVQRLETQQAQLRAELTAKQALFSHAVNRGTGPTAGG